MIKKCLGLGMMLLFFGCVTVDPGNKKEKKVKGIAGRPIAPHSFSIDAHYDPRLDGVIPGYKLLPVVVRNLSLRNIPMDVKTDRWTIVTDKGKVVRAMNSLKNVDPMKWRSLPEKMRNLMDYPEIVPINYSVTFDILLSDKTDLTYFKEIRYYNAAWKQEFLLEKDF